MKSYGFPIVPRLLTLRQIPKVLRNPIPVIEGNLNRFGDPYGVKVGPKKLNILVTRPEIIRHVLQKNHRNYRKSEIQTRQLASFIGTGILTLEGDDWRRQRRLVQPGFHKEKIESLSNVIAQTTDDFFKVLLKKGEEKTVNIHSEMMNLAFLIVSKALLGAQVNTDHIGALRVSIASSQQVLIKMIRLPFLESFFHWTGEIPRTLKQIEKTNAIIQSYIEAKRTEGIGGDDLLTTLMTARYEDTGLPMEEKQLLYEALVLFVAGHETSANALTWTLYLLDQNPDLKSHLIDQLAVGDDQYLKQVIQEALRLYPPAWITDRVTVEEDDLGEIRFPKNSLIVSFIYGAHRHPDYWSDPDKFDPDRFEPTKVESITPFSYLPFGGGPRLCIGMQFAMLEIEIVLKCFLQSIDFKLMESEKIGVKPLITLNPQGPVKTRVSLR